MKFLLFVSPGIPVKPTPGANNPDDASF